MSNLIVNQKCILDLFSDKKTTFLIPDYQRPYAWGETECQTLWDDLFNFTFPDNDVSKFDDNKNEYFLGSIVTFKNGDKLEVIDGQQRLTTLMLLLRAFYKRCKQSKGEQVEATEKQIEQCIWETDAFKKVNMNVLKIESEVATDDDKDEFLNILRTGEVDKNSKSRYAKNYRFFEEKINEFTFEYLDWYYLPVRVMNFCILLPIEAESQYTALRIFSTLNDRGKPLSDADIFKAQFYKYYSDKGEKDQFIERWKDLEVLCNDLFPSSTNSSLDEIFTRYMYYERAKKGIRSSTTEALRKFYERDGYGLLKNDETFENLIDLANFWKDVEYQNEDKFSLDVLKRLFVLNYAPNGMWTYFVSVYYMANRNDGHLMINEFCQFLDKIIAFIWTYAITNPGVNALRSPVYAEMIKVVNGQPVTFDGYLFGSERLRKSFNNYEFNNYRPITKSMLIWWAFQNPEQQLLKLETKLDIEHIYARNRYEKEHSLSNRSLLENLGNKAILEKSINIRASDYRFIDKRGYYCGLRSSRGKANDGTNNYELRYMAKTKTDFTEKDIEERYNTIIDGFIEFIDNNDLIDKK